MIPNECARPQQRRPGAPQTARRALSDDGPSCPTAARYPGPPPPEDCVPTQGGGRGRDRAPPTELPAIVKSVKDVVSKLPLAGPTGSPPPWSTPSSESAGLSSSDTPASASSPVMVTLPNSNIQVQKRLFDRLSKTRMSLYTEELALLLFGKETLASSSITEKHASNHKDLPEKDQLDPEKVEALIDCVIAQFPGTSAQEVKNILRRKCNNESFAKQKNSK